MKTPTIYDQQATDFLAHHGLKIAIKLSNSKVAPWEPCGNHYRVTLQRGLLSKDCWQQTPIDDLKKRMVAKLTFDFWGSQRDRENNRHPTPYDVLACIASDVHCPETFEDFCAEYGEDLDSRKAEQTFRRASAFARKLRAFFTDAEAEGLNEIQ